MQRIRVEFGSIDNLKAALDISKMKDEKVGELLNDLNKAMVSAELRISSVYDKHDLNHSDFSFSRHRSKISCRAISA